VSEAEIFIVGANGQLGTALKQRYPNAKSSDIDELDITDKESVEAFDWMGIKIILNAAAHTNVDGAETTEGQIIAQKVNADAVGYLADVAKSHNITLVHISTDYVFDGSKTPHREDEVFSPLNQYGKTKAAGDIAAASAPKHYILRTSWVIGEGKNFVRTMLELGKKGINPSVVADQIGRLTFTNELVRAIDYLLSKQCEFGTYNLSNDGPVTSWANITRKIFELAGYNNTVTDVTTAEYYDGKDGIAPRPLNSELDLSKIKSVGFQPKDWQQDLETYIIKELSK
jgi:dTDP-4-dehydrorhamnose 3,5-epimerase/reductase